MAIKTHFYFLINNFMKGYHLPGVTEGPGLSYIKWVKDPGTEDFPAFSLCMRWLVSVANSVLTILRYNLSLIPTGSHYEVILASVMNGFGSGNKDEVQKNMELL